MLSLITWFIVGVVFSILKLPIPAPLVFEWILWILGIWLWYKFITLL